MGVQDCLDKSDSEASFNDLVSHAALSIAEVDKMINGEMERSVDDRPPLPAHRQVSQDSLLSHPVSGLDDLICMLSANDWVFYFKRQYLWTSSDVITFFISHFYMYII